MMITPAFCRRAARTICSWATPPDQHPARPHARGPGLGEQAVHLLSGPGPRRLLHLVVDGRRDATPPAGADRDDGRQHVDQQRARRDSAGPRPPPVRTRAATRWRNPWDGGFDRSSCSSLSVAGAASTASGWRIMNTGTGAWRRTSSATEPKSSRPRPVRPWVAMAMRSAWLARARRQDLLGRPSALHLARGVDALRAESSRERRQIFRGVVLAHLEVVDVVKLVVPSIAIGEIGSEHAQQQDASCRAARRCRAGSPAPASADGDPSSATSTRLYLDMGDFTARRVPDEGRVERGVARTDQENGDRWSSAARSRRCCRARAAPAPLRPWLDITMRSALRKRAASTIASTGGPYQTEVSASATPRWPRAVLGLAPGNAAASRTACTCASVGSTMGRAYASTARSSTSLARLSRASSTAGLAGLPPRGSSRRAGPGSS